MCIYPISRRDDPWHDFRRRATEGVAAWLSRLPGGIEALAPGGARPEAGRLRALVRDRVTTNPVTREPLAPVQIHLLELVLGAVDWPALAVAGGPGDAPPARPRPAGPHRRPAAGGPGPGPGPGLAAMGRGGTS
jgi:hypothetical protein